MNFYDLWAWLVALPVFGFILWMFSFFIGWHWTLIIFGGLIAFLVYQEYWGESTPYRAPDEEITIIDNDGNSKTYRRK